MCLLFWFGKYKKFLKFKQVADCHQVEVTRAHEVEFEGFRGFAWGNSTFPLVITVFSAPNYCGFHGNKGAVLRIKVIIF